jgi:hypothetical protein
MATYKSSNEHSLWVSNVLNRTVVSCASREPHRMSMFILCDKFAEYLDIPKGKRSSSFMPFYDETDPGMWRSPIGWLIKVGTMEQEQEHELYELIDSETEALHGTYETLDEARGAAAYDKLAEYAIWHGNERVMAAVK